MLSYGFVTDRIGVGTTPDTEAILEILKGAGFTNFLNCRDDLDISALASAAGVSYCWDGTADWVPGSDQHKPVEWFGKGVSYALPIFTFPHEKLYVFCHDGFVRSTTMAWAIMRAFGLTSAHCFTALEAGRPGAFPVWYKDAEAALKTLGYL